MDYLPQQQAALDQLAAIPGVVGVLVFDVAGAIEASAFPAVFDAGGLTQLAARLTSDAYFQEWLAGDRATLSLRFQDGHVTVRALGGAWALVLCAAQTNEQLLSMSLTQLVHRLRKASAAARPVEPPAPAPPAAPTALDRLQEIARAELGEHAAKAVELLSAAGPKPKELVRAVADVEKMVRLFISKKKAEDLARRMREVLDA
jgi:predicted regulator of Ras-like GTPase activity (Roadblock/LC7/MglB family)